MGTVAGVDHGKLVTSASEQSLSKATTGKNSDMNEETFLKLLVAEMEYQDPLEPSSNTEYISQFAQFSQVESLSSMAANMDLTRASSLVGQEVYIKTENATGEPTYIQGKVDYVVYQSGKAYLSINENLYSLDDLDTVVDSDYIKAYNGAQSLIENVKKLPSVNAISIATEGAKIDDMVKQYADMSDYERGFVDDSTKKALESYAVRLSELRKQAQEAAQGQEGE